MLETSSPVRIGAPTLLPLRGVDPMGHGAALEPLLCDPDGPLAGHDLTTQVVAPRPQSQRARARRLTLSRLR